MARNARTDAIGPAARRNISQLLCLVVALTTFLALAVPMALAANGPTGQEAPQTRPICSAAAATDPPGKLSFALETTRLEDDEGFPIGSFLASKFAGPPVEWAVVTGFHYLSKLTGLDKILPKTQNAKILEQLKQLESQLAEIKSQLQDLSNDVSLLIREQREGSYRQAMAPLCVIANEQQVLFEQDYVPMIRAASELGRILESDNPAAADQKGDKPLSLRERVAALRDDFITAYASNASAYQTGINTLHEALIPGGDSNPVLTAFGKVRMSSRYLTRTDSERLRSLYRVFANTRALASWMAIEYWSSKPQNPEALENVVLKFKAHTAEERRLQPPMIPPGVVVDVGSSKETSADRKPMWVAPSAKALGWMPANGLAPPFRTIVIREVEEELWNFNREGPVFKGWLAPTKEEVRALISEGCAVDPGSRGALKGSCRNAVAPGSNVAAYLRPINREDKAWQQLFANPDSPSHGFIWTKDIVPQRLLCGEDIIGYPVNSSTVYDRNLKTYSGYSTRAGSDKFDASPRLPAKAPGFRSGRQLEAAYIKEACDVYFNGLAMGNKDTGTPRSPSFEGILLATRYTGRDERNEANTADLMAQPVAGGPSLRMATCAGQEATIIASRRDDTIRGTSGRDVIVAGPGDDVVRALGGRDLICGGGGEDLLLGGRGNDVLHGGAGDDVLRGGLGMDSQAG